MKIHKAGYSLLSIIFITLAIINIIIFFTWGACHYVYVVLAVTFILFLLILNFFRCPNREIIINNNNIIAPADGKIVVIEKTKEDEYLHKECMQISIFMSIFNVHINWIPINGVVKFFKHHSGNFHAAFLPKSSFENERTTIVIDDTFGHTILMRQIAGALARRIVTYVKAGDIVSQHEQAGFIKFGSRVDVFIPLDCDIKVKLGDKSVGSQTVLATFKKG